MYNVQNSEKIVVVTGAGSGIGAEFVKYYAEQGAKVVLIDMQQEPMQVLVDKLHLLHSNYLIVKLDITDEAGVKNAFEKIGKRFEKIDILINNAGISQISIFEKIPLNIFKKVMDVNFFGTVYTTKYALNLLKKARGQIITMSSVAGFSPLYGRTAYSASKHALHGFMNSLRAEVRSEGVKVLIACPAFVKTNIEQRTFNEKGEAFGKKKGTPGDVLTPGQAVAEIVKAAEKGKNIVYVSKIAKISRLISFFFPRYFERKMTEKVMKDF